MTLFLHHPHHLHERSPLIAAIINRSVRHLCIVDHGGDEHTISQWCENGVFAFFLADDKILVKDEHMLLGVGASNRSGEIVTNYVAPEGVGYGVGSNMMDYMEKIARERGQGCTFLISTAAARHFYIRRGYFDDGRPAKGVGLSWNFPMRKVFK